MNILVVTNMQNITMSSISEALEKLNFSNLIITEKLQIIKEDISNINDITNIKEYLADYKAIIFIIKILKANNPKEEERKEFSKLQDNISLFAIKALAENKHVVIVKSADNKEHVVYRLDVKKIVFDY